MISTLLVAVIALFVSVCFGVAVEPYNHTAASAV